MIVSDRFDPLSPDTISHPGGMLTPEAQVRVQVQRREFGVWVTSIVEERRNHLGDDFISDLVRAQFDGERPLNPRERASIVAQFLVAGNETTTCGIASGIFLLLENPDQLELVRSDPTLVPNLVEEVLRTESPVQAWFRVTTRPTRLDGVDIPAGVGVGLMYGCCNRDGVQFPDGDRFDVRRENSSRHLAFSQGIHFCPGAPLARLELQIAFELLLTGLKNLKLDHDRNDYTHVPSFAQRGLKHLYLQFAG